MSRIAGLVSELFLLEPHSGIYRNVNRAATSRKRCKKANLIVLFVPG
jgi:hypothetical protein